MEELRTIGNNMNDKNIPLVRRKVLQITAELVDMRIFKQRLEAGVVDTIGLASMLKVLATVSGQEKQHQKALFSGILSSNRLEVQLQQQLRVYAVGEMAKRNPVKYKKNKTESFVQKMSASKGTHERKHSTFKYEEKKKKSFIERVSGLLDYV